MTLSEKFGYPSLKSHDHFVIVGYADSTVVINEFLTAGDADAFYGLALLDENVARLGLGQYKKASSRVDVRGAIEKKWHPVSIETKEWY